MANPRLGSRAANPTTDAAGSFTEAPVWSALGAGWRPLLGGFRTLGFSFEWHDFRAAEELDWSRSFHPGSVELCLNLDGQATLADDQRTVDLRQLTSVFYFQGRPVLSARRPANVSHRFLTVEFAAGFLRRHFRDQAAHLHPCVQAVVRRTARRSTVTQPMPIGTAALQLVASLQQCPVFRPAQETWFCCKAIELAALSFFQPPDGELFCTRLQRAAGERAARVRAILIERLADPPTLEELGRLVGCSPFHLSRQFSASGGLTIQQFLRQARLERAAELLRAGRHNVTEAAMEVGYSSPSHFTVAFREAFGCCPGLYPIRTSPASPAAGAPTRRV